MKRIAALGATIFATAFLVTPVGAEIIHGQSSQDAFGFDADGTIVELVEVNPEFVEAWEIFAGTIEGARILSKLESNRDFEITIEVLPSDQFKGGDEVLGVSTLYKNPNAEGQTRAQIIIRSDDTFGVKALANTIYHEMRHVEHWIDGEVSDGDDDLHEQLDAGTDPGIVRFRSQRDDVPIPTTAPPRAKTPIYEAVMSRNQDDFLLVESALDFGKYLDLISAEPEPLVAEAVELEETVIVDGLDDALTELVEEFVENGVLAGEGGTCITLDDGVACGNKSGFGPKPGDVMIGGRAAGTIPLEGSNMPFGYFGVFDSDWDPSNNWIQQLGPHDPFQDSDRFYQMIYDPATGIWRFEVRQVEDGGSSADLDQSSNAFGIIQDDVAWFVIPREELPAEDPRVRVAMVGLDRQVITGLDVSGELSTDPLLGLDASRAGGRITGSASNSNLTIFSYGPTIVPHGGVLDAEFCLTDSSGNPIVGADVAATLGEPPDSSTASHNSGTSDDSGCIRLPLDVIEAAGESSLFFFDGSEVHPIGPISVIDLISGDTSSVETGSTSDSAEPDLLSYIYELYLGEGYTQSVVGEVNHVPDEVDDVHNPFGHSFDSLDTSLSTNWNVLWGDWFVVQSPDDPRALLGSGDSLVRVDPPDNFDYVTQTTGYTFYSTYTMAVDVNEPLQDFCYASVYARHPDLPTTLQASITDDNDPSKDMNMIWSVWITPDGVMVTTKSVVNAETLVHEFPTEHSTLGAVSGNELAVIFPASELEGVEAMRTAAGCTPVDGQDLDRYTRDLVADFAVGSGDIDPDIIFEVPEEPIEESDDGTTECTDPSCLEDPVEEDPIEEESISEDPTEERPATEAADESDEPAVADVAGIVTIALGVGMIGAGAWAYKKAGEIT